MDKKKRNIIILILLGVVMLVSYLLWQQYQFNKMMHNAVLNSLPNEYTDNGSMTADTGSVNPNVAVTNQQTTSSDSLLNPLLKNGGLVNYSFDKSKTCESVEKGESKGLYKMEITHNICKSPQEYHFSIFNVQMGGDVNKASAWFMNLNMELAMLTSTTVDNPPIDFKKVLKAEILEQKNVTNPDDIPNIHFDGGELHLESFESNGRNSTMKFTIYVFTK